MIIELTNDYLSIPKKEKHVFVPVLCFFGCNFMRLKLAIYKLNGDIQARWWIWKKWKFSGLDCSLLDICCQNLKNVTNCCCSSLVCHVAGCTFLVFHLGVFSVDLTFIYIWPSSHHFQLGQIVRWRWVGLKWGSVGEKKIILWIHHECARTYRERKVFLLFSTLYSFISIHIDIKDIVADW